MTNYHNKSVCDPEWLMEHLEDSHVIILDVSLAKFGSEGPDALACFEAGHIPGARFFDFKAVANPESRLPNMLPGTSEFTKYIQSLGISSDSTIVIYEADVLYSAARVWWMFRTFGHQDVRILNGGLRAWKNKGYRITRDVAVVSPGNFVARAPVSGWATMGDVQHASKSGESMIIDARLAGHFLGETDSRLPLPARTGHIPGSVNIPVYDLSDPDTGKLLHQTQYRQLFRDKGWSEDKPVIVTCGSGVTACALAFTLFQTGVENVSVYDGSWAEWQNYPENLILSGTE